ncbi:hypothetical protein D3C87_1711490 [compost metagenome]
MMIRPSVISAPRGRWTRAAKAIIDRPMTQMTCRKTVVGVREKVQAKVTRVSSRPIRNRPRLNRKAEAAGAPPFFDA